MKRPEPDVAVQTALPLDDLGEFPTATPHCQRWRDGRHSWRHVRDGGFDARRYRVVPIPESEGRPFTCQHHYAHSWVADIHRYGLRTGADDALVGVAVFGVPVNTAVLLRAFPSLEPVRASVELSRLVLLDDDRCPGNAETWFLARCFTALLDLGVRGVVSFADPVPRQDTNGKILMAGHAGVLYQAKGAIYTGRATPRTRIVLPDGAILNDRAAQKVRAQEAGHASIEQRLIRLGATVPRAGVRPSDWLRQALIDVGARRQRHRGVHRYLFPLGHSQRDRDAIPLGLTRVTAWPKRPDVLPPTGPFAHALTDDGQMRIAI